ncbi:MAG: hypothetical protein KA007_03035 [Candidatus Pacebacteria bacterium]|jgi:hypothetical protein|nr:hypothetical protein [Candidatus Paceibacterota bacterium]
MNDPIEKFNIDSHIKPGFDLVVELDDEVEYIVDKEIVESIRNNQSTVNLKRLIDGEIKIVALDRIIKSLQKEGPVDYLKTQ